MSNYILTIKMLDLNYKCYKQKLSREKRGLLVFGCMLIVGFALVAKVSKNREKPQSKFFAIHGRNIQFLGSDY